jgi:predicted acyltransferase
MSESITPADPKPAQARLHSLDAYRGLIMISLAFNGFGLAASAANMLKTQPDSTFWAGVQYQFSHTEWVGCSYWDMIQPSFMFMVGVSMAYSYAKRQSLGDSYGAMFAHAVSRAVILVLLSIVLMSTRSQHTNWGFTNVLAQIGLGYPFLFLLWGRSLVVQTLAAIVLLVATWGIYEAYPNAGIDLATGAPSLGVSQEWAQEHLTDVDRAWHKNANVARAFDVWLLNKFPSEETFVFNGGGYYTLNFVPSIVTMLFGLMCGQLLRLDRPDRFKLMCLVIAGIAGIAAGSMLDVYSLVPLVKRMWTPSWALFSTGWCCLILAFLYGLIDVLKLRSWSFPLVVVGMNSIAIYCMSMTLKPWVARQLQTHFGEDVFNLYGVSSPAFAPTVQATLVGLCFWLVCYYMYRNRIFIRI